MLRSIDPKLVFEVFRDDCGQFSARCLNAHIVTRGSDIEELHDNLTAAVADHFPGEEPPSPDLIHLLMFPE